MKTSPPFSLSGLILCVCVYCLHAATIQVPTDQPSIQSAIDLATESDTVLVHPGVYYENVTCSKELVIGSLFLTTGDTSYVSQTVLDGSSGNVVTFNQTPGSPELIGLCLRNGNSGVFLDACQGAPVFRHLVIQGNVYGVNSENSNTQVFDSQIRNNTVHACFFVAPSTPILENVLITGSGSSAIRCEGGTSPQMSGLSICDNSSGIGAAIFCEATPHASMVLENSILRNNASSEVYLLGVQEDPGSFAIGCSNVQGAAASVQNDGYFTLNWNPGNIDADPLFCDSANGNYTLRSDSPCLPGNHPDEESCDTIGAFGQGCNAPSHLIEVPVDQPTIQAAINAAADGDTVLIHPGVYYENVNYNSKEIVLGSLFLTTSDTSYVSQTILDGSGGNVVTLEYVEGTPELVGLSIRNGNAGVRVDACFGSPVLNQLVIQDNTHGLYNTESSTQVFNSIIRNNTGHACQFIAPSSPLLQNVLITGSGSSAIYCGGSVSPQLDGVTICGNANGVGAAIYCDYTIYANVQVVNSILRNNAASEIYLFTDPSDPASLSIGCSDIQGGQAAIDYSGGFSLDWQAGNFDADPLFCESANGNYTLRADSPCLPGNHPDEESCDTIGAFGQGCDAPSHLIEVPIDQPTIQAAINVAADGDTVLIHPGVYYENVNYNNKEIVLGSLFLTTSDTSYVSQTIVDGSGGIVVTLENVPGSPELIGLSLRNGSTGVHLYECMGAPVLKQLEMQGNACGIGSELSSPQVYNSKIQDITGHGCHFTAYTMAVLHNVLISGCESSAIYCIGSTNLQLSGATICDNASVNGAAIYCENTPQISIQIEKSILRNNAVSEIHAFTDVGMPSSLAIACSNIQGGQAAIDYSGGFSLDWQTGNFDADPLFCDSANGNYTLRSDSPCLPGNHPDEESCDTIGAFGQGCDAPSHLIEVPVDQPTIQAAINVAADGDTVLVQPGIYQENVDFCGKNILVASMMLLTDSLHYRSETVIDGGHLSSVVVFENGESSAARLHGFSIIDGLGREVANGGGIRCYNSSPTLEYLDIYNCTTEPYVYGAGIYCHGSNLSLCNSRIHENGPANCGVECWDSSLSLNQVELSDNSIALRCWSSSVTLTRVTIAGATTCLSIEPMLPVRNNNTINIFNSILWPTSGYILDVGESTSGNVISVECSDMKGGEFNIEPWGTVNWMFNNFDLDPMFCDPGAGDFALTSGSPCLPGNHPIGWECGLIGAYGQGCVPLIDCNNNGIADSLDLAQGTSSDCNLNSIPDECDIADATSLDCNTNLIPDECEAGGVTVQEHLIGTVGGTAYAVHACDLDGDTDLDALVSLYGDHKVGWFENTDGAGSYGPLQVISTDVNWAFAVDAADVDNDGDLDVFSASITDNKIAWYENTDGAGSFGAQQVISSSASGARDVFAIDMDADGDVDLLTAHAGANKVCWYENTDGAGSFGPEIIINTSAHHVQSVFATDLDADGDLDVISASTHDDKVAWYQNLDGAGGSWSTHLITTTADYAISVYAADLDADGDQDVLSASAGDNRISWFENTDGAGTFSAQQVISDSANSAYCVIACDFDGDGDQDVASASCQGSRVAWYENTDGTGSFGPPQILATAEYQGQCVVAADLDTDGDLDILAGIAEENKVVWFEQSDLDCNGNGVPDACDIADFTSQDCNLNGIPDECEISVGLVEDCNENGVPDLCDIAEFTSLDCNLNGIPDECDISAGFAEDCNGNGVPDACDITESISLDCNLNAIPDECDIANLTSLDCNANIIPDECEAGSMEFFEQMIDSSFEEPRALASADLDGDGHLDLVVGSGHGSNLGWYENTGAGLSSFTLRYIPTTTSGHYSLRACDLDQDGDQDIVTSGYFSDRILWLENNGAAIPVFTEHTVARIDWSYRIAIADLDADGDPDVLGSNYDDSELWWFENDGAAMPSFSHHPIATGVKLFDIQTADLDNDRDVDIVVSHAGSSERKILWFENNGSATPYFSQYLITESGAYGQAIPIDLDQDSHLDVLSQYHHSNKIVYYKNDGAIHPSFTEIVIDSLCGWSSYVAACDLDGDGDPDVVAAGHELCWYENTDDPIPSFSKHQFSTVPLTTEAIEPADLDQDGDMDLICSDTQESERVFIYEQTDFDCNGNLIPDDCDISELSSLDCNQNGIPDECEIRSGMTRDFNHNGTPDNCEVLNLDRQLLYQNLSLAIADAYDQEHLQVYPALYAASPSIDFAQKALSLRIVGDALQSAGSTTTLSDGASLFAEGGRLSFAGTLLTTAGDAVYLAGTELAVLPGGNLRAASASLVEAQLAGRASILGDLRVDPLAMFATSDTLSLGGNSEFYEACITAGAISNSGELSFYSGSMLCENLLNEGRFQGWGALYSSMQNDSLLLVQSDLQIIDDFVNNGTTVIQQGALTVLGNLLNNSVLHGYPGGSLALAEADVSQAKQANPWITDGALSADEHASWLRLPQLDHSLRTESDSCSDATGSKRSSVIQQQATRLRSVQAPLIRDTDETPSAEDGSRTNDPGLTVLGDYFLSQEATLLLPSADLTLKVGGNFDCAIDAPERFRLEAATLQLVGDGSEVQQIEVMSSNAGVGTRGQRSSRSASFPIGCMRIGPAPTEVCLVDQHDNDGFGQGTAEALFVDELIVEAGSLLRTSGLQVYYNTIDLQGEVDDPANLQPVPNASPVVEISLQGTMILLNWNSVPEADFYRIYAAGVDGVFTLLTETTGTVYLEQEPDAVPGGLRLYQVTAVKE